MLMLVKTLYSGELYGRTTGCETRGRGLWGRTNRPHENI
jgi:hypothetical protein